MTLDITAERRRIAEVKRLSAELCEHAATRTWTNTCTVSEAHEINEATAALCDAHEAALAELEANAADFARLSSWLADPNRKPSHLAFTAGPLREIADCVEAQLAAKDAEIERLNKLNDFRRRQTESLEIARPLCPDCRDKCRGEQCLRCQIQRNEAQLARLRRRVDAAEGMLVELKAARSCIEAMIVMSSESFEDQPSPSTEADCAMAGLVASMNTALAAFDAARG